MKISIYALHLSFGGVEKYVITLANMLASEHDVEIVSTYKIDEQPAFAVDPRVKIVYLLDDLKPNKAELKDAIRRRKIGAILREGWRAVRVLLAKKRVNIKSLKACDSDVVISTRIFHNKLIGKYIKHAVKITGEHNHHNNDPKYIAEVIDSCRGFDYFVPISKELCNDYRRPMEEIGVKTEYIKFCIDPNPSYRAPELVSSDLISVGRLSPEKGACDLVKVFAGVHRRHPEAKLHIVGDGADYDKVRALIEENELSDGVVMHGYQTKPYIYDLLPQTSLYVMTSFTESFGLVLLEAMSCGIPCVAFSSAQGAHEIINDGENGFLIDNRDFAAMEDKICTLLEDRDALHTLSAGALKTADEFSYEKTHAAWLDLMKRLTPERTHDKEPLTLQ